jgi:signal transduction histidine kinase
VNFPKDYAEVIRSSQNEDGYVAGEQQRFGAHHGEVGAWLIGNWHLQSFMADAVLFHHDDTARILDALPLVKIVFLANMLSLRATGQTESGEEEGKHLFDFSSTDIDGLVSQAEEQVEQVARSLGMEIAAPDRVSDPDEVYQEEVDLLRTVRDVSLLQGTLQNLLQAYGKKEILAIAKQGLQVLLDVDPVVFLLYEPEENILRGQEGADSGRNLLVKELVVSLESENTLLVQSVVKRKPLDSFGQLTKMVASILDRQIIRLMGKDGMLCLPMMAHNHIVGTIILGLSQEKMAALRSQMNLLSMYVDHMSLALYADHVRQNHANAVQTERLAAASSVARKVVHEVNNPLGIIKNYIKIFGLKLPKDDPVQEELKIINEELDRVALIVQGLSDFSEPVVRQTEPVDVNNLLTALTKISRESLSKNAGVTIHLELDETLPTVFSEKNGLKQVFINLIKNAAEAMPDGGNLFIKTLYPSPIPDETTSESLQDHPRFVEIRIRDEGTGIPDDMQSKLFEPYVTTKKGDHAGLGLSVAYNIVKELGGSLTCESKVGHGTTFMITLPVNQGAS